MTVRVPYLVIGAGAVGLATTWQLARRGYDVLALERFEPGHTRGASHGTTRNFNNAYSAADYLDLLDLARVEWKALENSAGEPLLVLHGLVTHGDDRKVACIYAALAARDERVEILTPADAARRWSGMRFQGDVLHSRDAGVVRAEAALRAMERDAAAHGADIRFAHSVLGLEEAPDGVTARIATGRERYEVVADTVVITAGAWTPRILPAPFPLPRLTVTEESPAHFAAIEADSTWPSFNHLVGRESYPGDVYGMPTPGEGIKVGFHLVGPVVDPDARTFQPLSELAARLDEYVATWMPGLDPGTATPISCTYTSTESEDFVLDRRGRIVVGAGFSGHGFKFTPALGSVLADLATDETACAARTFRIGR